MLATVTAELVGHHLRSSPIAHPLPHPSLLQEDAAVPHLRVRRGHLAFP